MTTPSLAPSEADSAARLQPYLPRLVRYWNESDSGRLHRSVEGSMVLMDISGFTKMSERLARHGNVGAEEVTEVIDTTFGRLLPAAYTHGANLLKFGGDAQLLLFTGEGHPLRAAAAAHDMRAELRRIGGFATSAGKVVLRMSIGVHTGTFDFFLVGASHQELIVAGPAATRTVQMEAAASAAQILVSPETAALLPRSCIGAASGPGCLLRRSPRAEQTGFRPARSPDVDLQQYIPRGLRQTLLDTTINPEHRPAIVYASTRKHAEQYAELLAHDFHTAPYHAGLQPAERDRIQAAFLKGHLEVIVATTAFGMGIDKADVRTVIHAALPASLEGYYQELGRAGRDGKDSRAVLLHAFVDRRTHEFFHRRDYPDPTVLERLYQATSNELEPKASLQARVRGDPEVFDKALEQLWIHGGVEMTPDEDVRRGRAGWAVQYIAQRERKQLHLEQMGRYAEAHGCRMRHLVAHFGDVQDSGAACGLCDVCAPETCAVVRFEEPSALESHALGRILEALHARDGQATGRLHRELFGEALHRRDFERLVGGLVRSGLVRLDSDSFDKDGQVILFQRLSLTDTGRRARVIAPGQVVLPQAREESPKKRRGRATTGAAAKRPSRKRASTSAEAAPRSRGKRASTGTGTRRAEPWQSPASQDFEAGAPAPGRSGWKARPTDEPSSAPRASWNASRNASRQVSDDGYGAPEPAPALVESLKAWRLTEARKRKVPAFRILTDRVLDAIASARPSSGAELMSIHGVGPALTERYGVQILTLVSRRR